MDRRKVFDSVPEQFDRWRGHYTPALFDFLISACGLGPGTRVLELGPGTGQATDFALDAGCDYTGIELGDNFARILTARYGDRENFHLIHGDFELHPFEKERFDFVYSAATIQWIDPRIAFSKCYDILKPGGCLAMFILSGDYKTPNPALFAEIQQVYDAYNWSRQSDPTRFPYLDAPKYGFSSEEQYAFPGARVYNAQDYIEFIHTHSDHILLDPALQDGFYGAIRDAILRHGDRIEFIDTFRLYLCRK